MDVLSSALAVAVVSLLAAISPGPDFLIVVKNSLSQSRKMGFLTALGVSTALLIHISYTLIGIGVLIAENAFIYHLLKYAGAAYLFYIGCKGFISSFKQHKTLDFSRLENVEAHSSRDAYKQGFLTNLLNPKCALFFISLFSQFIQVTTPWYIKLLYGSINWAVSLGWFLFLSYIITGKFIRNRTDRFRMYIDRVMGIVLMLLSLKIIIS